MVFYHLGKGGGQLEGIEKTSCFLAILKRVKIDINDIKRIKHDGILVFPEMRCVCVCVCGG